jgi:uroporphyrinogen-III synthase
MYPDLKDSDYDTVIMTSKNSVYATTHLTWLRDKKIYCIGESTKQLLTKYNYTNITSCLEEAQNATSLAELIKQNESRNSKILYISGLDIASDIENQLLDSGYHIAIQIVYKTILTSSVSQQALEPIQDLVKVVLFYSPRSALAFTKLSEKYDFKLQNKAAICISNNTADILKDCWGKILVSKNSDEDSIIDCLLLYCQL